MIRLRANFLDKIFLTLSLNFQISHHLHSRVVRVCVHLPVYSSVLFLFAPPNRGPVLSYCRTRPFFSQKIHLEFIFFGWWQFNLKNLAGRMNCEWKAMCLYLYPLLVSPTWNIPIKVLNKVWNTLVLCVQCLRTTVFRWMFSLQIVNFV